MNEIDYEVEGISQEDAENLLILYRTTQESIPLNRSMGISKDIIGKSIPETKNILVREINRITEEYAENSEKEIYIDDVVFLADESDIGKLMVRVVLEDE